MVWIWFIGIHNLSVNMTLWTVDQLDFLCTSMTCITEVGDVVEWPLSIKLSLCTSSKLIIACAVILNRLQQPESRIFLFFFFFVLCACVHERQIALSWLEVNRDFCGRLVKSKTWSMILVTDVTLGMVTDSGSIVHFFIFINYLLLKFYIISSLPYSQSLW